jgi:putative sporulation protein YtxC
MFDSDSFAVSLDEMIIVDIKDDKKEDIYIDFVSNILTKYVIAAVEPNVIRDEVEKECQDFFSEDIEDIFERVQWQLLHRSEEITNSYFNRIKEDIFDGLKKHGMFNLNGFLNFKYSMRRLEIRDYINMVLDEYLTDDESDQFVSLLRKFVTIQQAKTDLIHIVVLGQNDYELITGNQERIDLKDVEKILDEMVIDENNQIEQLHLIMSVLMTLSPSEIIIHTNDEQDPYVGQTLKKIYEDRATICHGCEFCEAIRTTRN